MKLHSIHIPTTWHTFDPFLGNTYFYLDNLRIEIPSGNYNITDLIIVLNTSVHNVVPDLPELFIYNKYNNRISILEYPNSIISNIILYDETNTFLPPQNTYFAKINQSLGWAMGFRLEKDNNGIVSLPINITHIAHAPVNIFGYKFFSLSIDDYNQNIHSNSIVTIGSNKSIIQLPTNYTPEIQCINENSINKTPTILPSYPRKFTLSQMYSINETIASQKKNNNRVKQNIVNNTLTIIPVTENALTNSATNKPYINMDRILGANIRRYFGPVNIERMKISLHDLNGNIVNLQGADWSFTLTIEQLHKQKTSNIYNYPII